MALVDLLKRIAETEACNAGADRPRLAARAEALDRSHSRHHEAGTARGEPGRGRSRTHAGRSRSEIEDAAVEDLRSQGARLPEAVLKCRIAKPIRSRSCLHSDKGAGHAKTRDLGQKRVRSFSASGSAAWG